MRARSRRGFTLGELLVALVLTALLAALIGLSLRLAAAAMVRAEAGGPRGRSAATLAELIGAAAPSGFRGTDDELTFLHPSGAVFRLVLRGRTAELTGCLAGACDPRLVLTGDPPLQLSYHGAVDGVGPSVWRADWPGPGVPALVRLAHTPPGERPVELLVAAPRAR